jgi:hypothetical protein
MGKRLTVGLAIVAVTPLLYVAAYLCNVVTVTEFMSVTRGPLYKVTEYRIGGRFAEVVFGPANALDRRIRSDYWIVDQSEWDPTDPDYHPHRP